MQGFKMCGVCCATMRVRSAAHASRCRCRCHCRRQRRCCRPAAAALGLKKAWQEVRKAAGKDYSKPNLVMGSQVRGEGESRRGREGEGLVGRSGRQDVAMASRGWGGARPNDS